MTGYSHIIPQPRFMQKFTSRRPSSDFKTSKGVENTRRSRAFNDFRSASKSEEDFLTSVYTDFSNPSVSWEKIVKKLVFYVISSSDFTPTSTVLISFVFGLWITHEFEKKSLMNLIKSPVFFYIIYIKK